MTRLYPSYIGIPRRPDLGIINYHRTNGLIHERNNGSTDFINGSTDQRTATDTVTVYGYSQSILLHLRYLRVLRLHCIVIPLFFYSLFFPLPCVVLPHHIFWRYRHDPGAKPESIRFQHTNGLQRLGSQRTSSYQHCKIRTSTRRTVY